MERNTTKKEKSRLAHTVGSAVPYVKKYWVTAAAILAAIASFAICLYYILGPSEGYLHSDCTDSLYWANATVESGSILDENYRYAAILPFSSSVWFVPLILMFGFSMKAQLIGMSIFLVLFTASIYFMCRSMKWSIASTCGMISALLLMLSGSDKLREIMWGHVIYYSLGLLILFTGLGLALRFMNNLDTDKPKTVRLAVYAALLLVLFAGNGTNGFQLIVISTLPILGAIVAERLLDGKTPLLSRKNLSPCATVLLIGLATVVGMALLNVIKGDKIANYTSVYSTLSATSAWVDNLLKFPNSFFTLLGAEISAGAELFDKATVFALVKLIGGLLILVFPVIMLCRYKTLKDRGTRLLLWAHIVTTAVILFGFVVGKLSNANWRLVPMVGTGIAATVAGIKELIDARHEAKAKGSTAENTSSYNASVRLGVLLLLVCVLFCTVNFYEIKKMPADYGRENTVHLLTKALEERGLEYGYATFWYSQAITLLSDSQVRVRETLVKNTGVITDYYQSSKLWYETQEGIDEYFILLTQKEYATVMGSAYWQEITREHLTEQFQPINGFFVFVFDENVILKGEFNG